MLMFATKFMSDTCRLIYFHMSHVRASRLSGLLVQEYFGIKAHLSNLEALAFSRTTSATSALTLQSKIGDNSKLHELPTLALAAARSAWPGSGLKHGREQNHTHEGTGHCIHSDHPRHVNDDPVLHREWQPHRSRALRLPLLESLKRLRGRGLRAAPATPFPCRHINPGHVGQTAQPGKGTTHTTWSVRRCGGEATKRSPKALRSFCVCSLVCRQSEAPSCGRAGHREGST